MALYISMALYVYIYIYIYIADCQKQKDRERERERVILEYGHGPVSIYYKIVWNDPMMLIHRDLLPHCMLMSKTWEDI